MPPDENRKGRGEERKIRGGKKKAGLEKYSLAMLQKKKKKILTLNTDQLY